MTRTVKIILCALAVLIAAGVTLYPLLSNRYAEKTKSLIETQYTEAIQQLDESELIAAREAAHEYNTTLVNVTDKAFSKEALIRASESYDTLLNIRGDGLMGYVEIPKISVNLPIYHGTGEDSLGRGIGHLLGSSLPVGGNATHCILTGHSGLAREKMFSDLDQLEKGDIFFSPCSERDSGLHGAGHVYRAAGGHVTSHDRRAARLLHSYHLYALRSQHPPPAHPRRAGGIYRRD